MMLLLLLLLLLLFDEPNKDVAPVGLEPNNPPPVVVLPALLPNRDVPAGFAPNMPWFCAGAEEVLVLPNKEVPPAGLEPNSPVLALFMPLLLLLILLVLLLPNKPPLVCALLEPNKPPELLFELAPDNPPPVFAVLLGLLPKRPPPVVALPPNAFV